MVELHSYATDGVSSRRLHGCIVIR
jgi:hypothetical protein